MRAVDVELVGALVHRVPELSPLLQEHLDDYDGLLPHVFMGDVTRWVVERFRADPSDINLSEVLAFVESWLQGAEDDEAKELILASFVENLPGRKEDGGGVRDALGPGLRGQLR